MKIYFPDGNSKEFAQGASAYEIAQAISVSLAKNAIAAKVDGELYDLHRPINHDAHLEIVTDTKELTDLLNHSCAHLLAQAIKEMYPQALFGVGPTIEEGFYYDMDLGDVKISEENFGEIERKMLKLAEQNFLIVRKEFSRSEALEFFKNDKYKVELINDLPEGEVITAYSQGSFTDLCRGPHLPSTKWLRHFKLLNVSGAYFRGDSKREQLQRIYGIAFFTKEELTKYLELVEERKKRDHRRLGKELDLFMISEFGPGFPFWLPNGMILRRNLEEFWYKIHTQAGYQLIQTPIMLDKSLWEISGHWTNYRENMYVAEIDDREFAIKPMNCPGGILVYKRDIHSYKDFPLRLAELGLVHRHEASGALTGLFRVRNFTQDDAHIYLRFDQIVDEVARLIDLFDYVYGIFNLSYHIELSTRPEEKYIGSIEVWNKAEEALADACTKAGHEFKVNPGDGAFYGPKLDFKLRDSMGRIWQCGTIQLDMNLPERFDLHYINDQGEKVRPIMLHRALFGSLERFIGILIEHYAGAFPLWLAPRQIVIVPVNNASHGDYANKLKEILAEQDFRVEVDMRDEKMNYKIREAQTKKIPYTIVVGDKEKHEQLITYRPYGKNESKTLSIAEFVAKLTEEVKTFGKSKE